MDIIDHVKHVSTAGFDDPLLHLAFNPLHTNTSQISLSNRLKKILQIFAGHNCFFKRKLGVMCFLTGYFISSKNLPSVFLLSGSAGRHRNSR